MMLHISEELKGCLLLIGGGMLVSAVVLLIPLTVYVVALVVVISFAAGYWHKEREDEWHLIDIARDEAKWALFREAALESSWGRRVLARNGWESGLSDE